MPSDRSTKTPLVFLLALFLGLSVEGRAVKSVNYQPRLNPRFHKQIRRETRFIIVHSTESSLPSALRTLSRGKVRLGRYVTRGGHAHYLIAKNGTIYRILDHKYWANHAGVSMWKGLNSLSDYSIGIELEGYHDLSFSADQYKSLHRLVKDLQERYEIKDRDVLEHYRVAYSLPNRYHTDNQRGRKLDPGFDNFDRAKAGLTDEYPQDPDVIAGRIDAGPGLMRAGGHSLPGAEIDEDEETAETATTESELNRITRARTAWQIAGVQYQASTTIYHFPGGRSLSGAQIKDWSDIPPGTQVDVGVAPRAAKKMVNTAWADVVVPEITPTQSAWKIANALQRSSMTFYVLPDGRVLKGSSMAKNEGPPHGSKVLVAYRDIEKPQTRSPLGEDLEDVYLASQTLYLFPKQTLRSGDQIENFTQLPANIRVFSKVE